jgi:hypothetical protein
MKKMGTPPNYAHKNTLDKNKLLYILIDQKIFFLI